MAAEAQGQHVGHAEHQVEQRAQQQGAAQVAQDRRPTCWCRKPTSVAAQENSPRRGAMAAVLGSFDMGKGGWYSVWDAEIRTRL
jgi:hypothetical protein